LANEESTARIPEKETAYAQAQYAFFVGEGNDPEAWQAVLDYHGDSSAAEDQLWVTRARQTLAMLYLQKGDYELALPYFRQLEDMSVVNSEPRAQGLAGQIVIFAIRKDPQMADKLGELRKLMTSSQKKTLSEMVGQDMRNEINSIITQRMKSTDENGRKALEDLQKALNASPSST